MKRFGFLLAAISALALMASAHATTRPHYGGTLRVATRSSLNSLDPLEAARTGSLAEKNLCSLVFETLITLDDHGKPQPSLAVSWQTDPGDLRWTLQIRKNVNFHDGSPLTADQVAASLRMANPAWRISALGESVVIQRDTPAPDLLAELALLRNAIVKHASRPLGTGAFAVSDWAPGKKFSLKAYENYWGAKPYLNSIEVSLGQGFREQALAFDSGKADVIEIAPEQLHQTSSQNKRMKNSSPTELVALVFARDPQSDEDRLMRTTLALSLDRSSINNVLLQNAGEPSGALLPNWLTGYAFLFPASMDSDKARVIRGDLRLASPWTLAFDPNDPTMRLIAERVILNSRDVSLAMQPASSSAADIRLVRIPLDSINAAAALESLTRSLGLNSMDLGSVQPESLYSAENKVLQNQRVIPLLHLRSSHAVSENVNDWAEGPNGNWRLSDVWLSASKP